MEKLSYKAFAELTQISTRVISTYVKRGKLVVDGDFVDTCNEVNKSFISLRKSKLDGTYTPRGKYVRKTEKKPVKPPKEKKPSGLPNYLHCPHCQQFKTLSDYSVKHPLPETKCDPCKAQLKEFYILKRISREKARKQKPEVARRSRQKRVALGKKAAEVRALRESKPLYRFKEGVRTAVYMSLRKNGFKKSSKTESIIGCTLDKFKEHIQSLFQDGMSFDNYGEWHIDHNIPLATAKTEEDVIRLNHYTNLRPLWAIDNLRKGAKIAA